MRFALLALAAAAAMPAAAPAHAQVAPARPASPAPAPGAPTPNMASPTGAWPMSFVEFQWINAEASSVEEAQAFVAKLIPRAALHGVRIEAMMLVTGVAKGEATTPVPDLVLVYTFPNAASMTAMQTDPEYARALPDRNRIFDFTRNMIWRTTPIAPNAAPPR